MSEPGPEGTPQETPPAAQPSRRGRASQAQGGGQTPAQISVRVGQLAARTRTITGAPGMTVAAALQQAGVGLDKATAIIQGVAVEGTRVLQNGELIVVSSNVRGGSR